MSPQEKPLEGRPVGHAGARVDVNERKAFAMDGFLALFLALGLFVGSLLWAGLQFTELDRRDPSIGILVLCGLMLILSLLMFSAVTIVQPGQTKVLQFFGRYVGTIRRTGLSMVLPLTTKRTVSVRVNNFETNSLKVNDADGNPVDIGAIIVWQVADTARASFSVEYYDNFVKVQSEAALRHVATTHPYDDYTGKGTSLRGSTDVVSAELAHEVAERVAVAGVEVVEVRISHLAYSPEIAQAMLQRQQASAIVAARATIVDGAVGMVEMALEKLEDKSIVELDEERKATMVSNLLVVLCGDQNAHPVINTGSLYS